MLPLRLNCEEYPQKDGVSIEIYGSLLLMAVIPTRGFIRNVGDFRVLSANTFFTMYMKGVYPHTVDSRSLWHQGFKRYLLKSISRTECISEDDSEIKMYQPPVFKSSISVSDSYILLWLTADDFTRQREKSRTRKS